MNRIGLSAVGLVLCIACGPPPEPNNPGGDGPLEEALRDADQELEDAAEQTEEELEDTTEPTDDDPVDDASEDD